MGMKTPIRFDTRRWARDLFVIGCGLMLVSPQFGLALGLTGIVMKLLAK
jgi:hypothetical protein